MGEQSVDLELGLSAVVDALRNTLPPYNDDEYLALVALEGVTEGLEPRETIREMLDQIVGHGEPAAIVDVRHQSGANYTEELRPGESKRVKFNGGTYVIEITCPMQGDEADG